MEAFLDRVYSFLDSQFYLRAVDRTHPDACEVCGGVKGGKQYRHCYQCFIAGHALPSRLGFGFYARSDTQDGFGMHGYKSLAAGNGQSIFRSVIGSTIYLAIREYQERWGADLITTVPSLSGRSGEHPLISITRNASAKLGGPPVEQVLKPLPSISHPRTLNKQHFSVEGNVAGQRVLLVDDTWVSGGHALSASESLKAAGAEVGVFVVARWLRTDGAYDGTRLYEEAGAKHTSFRNVRFFDSL